MTIEYFLGRYQPDQGEPDEYDGNLWIVDTDCDRLGENGERIHVDPEPQVLAGIGNEEQATYLRFLLASYETTTRVQDAALKRVEERLKELMASRDAALAMLKRLADGAEPVSYNDQPTAEEVAEFDAALAAAREMLAKTDSRIDGE